MWLILIDMFDGDVLRMAEQKELVSIVVPVYGTEAFLPACIESLCKQTYSNLQIILVDDQSPDSCPKICDEYARKDNRITVIHQENTGVSGARNTGLRHVAGDYVMFVDSDDELYPDAVNCLLQDAREYAADIVWAPYTGSAKSDTEKETPIVLRKDSSLVLSLDGAHNINAVWSKLFKTEFIKGISFEEGKNINEDGFFMFLCYMRAPVLVKHPMLVYRYNVRTDSCSRQVFSDKYLAMLYFCDRKKELITEQYPQHTDKLHNMEVRTNLQLLDLLCTSKNRQYRDVRKRCISTVRRLQDDHKPINEHHRKLAWIVTHGFYPLYRFIYRIKYRR